MTAASDFAQPVSGRAYSGAFRVLATAVTAGLLLYGARVVLGAPDPSRDGWILIGAIAFALIGTWYFMMVSVTTIDADGVRQSGIIERKVAWSEILHARVRGFAFSRRLVVRTIGGRYRFFYGGTPELLAAFARVETAFPLRRK